MIACIIYIDASCRPPVHMGGQYKRLDFLDDKLNTKTKETQYESLFGFVHSGDIQ